MMDHASYNIGTINIANITNSTKLDALATFIHQQDLDVVFLQEVENEQLSLPGYNVVCNVDHARRGTAIAMKQYIRFSHVEKSLDGRLIALRVQNTTFCNIYAPSGTILRGERERFFNNTVAYYLRHQTENTVLAGDFNCVLRPSDSSGTNTSPALRATVNLLQLVDVWIELYPNTAGHTYVRHNCSSRLDRVYVNRGLVNQLRETSTHVCAFTDHRAVTVRLCLPSFGRQPGRGFWSLRPHLLTSANLAELNLKWQFWTRQRRNHSTWMAWWLSVAKPKLKSFFRWKSREVYNDFHREHQRLYVQLRQECDRYYQHPEVLTTINRIKGKMLALQREFSRAFVRINESLLAGEPISTYTLGERKRKQTLIHSLETEEESLIQDSHAIENHVHQYFSRLYANNNASAVPADQYTFRCERIIPDEDVHNDACTSTITTREIYEAIKTSASRKSPGPDGIPKEFFLRAFDTIHREINLVLNEALFGNIPPEFVEGIIVLAKKKNSGSSISAFRPISLLNFDYKILSRVLKRRIEEVMRDHRILSRAQSCSNAERNIFQSVLSLKDRIAQLTRTKQKAKLISFDLDHAFDRVDREFLHNTMRGLGFKEQLIDLLSRIADASTSRILINGHLSEAFPIERSVRQGDPLSMHLFVIYLHPLVDRLERVSGSDLVVAYADDISVIATTTEAIERIRRLFATFEGEAGAKLNLQKTNAIDVGVINHSPLHVPWLQTNRAVKILGISFVNSIREMINCNWDALVGKFSQVMWLHSRRSLNLRQKVTLLNTFITAKIWYVSSILPPKAVHTAKITSTMGRFLWFGLPARIPMQQLARPYGKGGMQLHLPALKCKALLLHRHLKEIDSMPFYNSILEQDLPLPLRTPDLPCLQLIVNENANLPTAILSQLSSSTVHEFYVEQTDAPRVERKYTNQSWRSIWKNISSRQLTSQQKSILYMIVNEKTNHRQLMYRMQREDGEICSHCNAAVETMQHKYAECQRVLASWALLQQKLHSIHEGWRRLTYNELFRPELNGIRLHKRTETMELLVNYVTFIDQCNDGVNNQALNFHLMYSF